MHLIPSPLEAERFHRKRNSEGEAITLSALSIEEYPEVTALHCKRHEAVTSGIFLEEEVLAALHTMFLLLWWLPATSGEETEHVKLLQKPSLLQGEP